MNDFDKTKLAKLNNFSQERYVDIVKENMVKSEYDKDKENAIVRKMLYAIVDKEIRGTPISEEILSEFLKYYEYVEKIKSEAKSEIS